MDYILSIEYQIYKNTALKHICVDWYQSQNLGKFYCNECGFKIFKSKTNGKMNLISAFYKYS